MRMTETTISGSCNTLKDLGEELDAVVRRFPHEHADDDREESRSDFSDILIHQTVVQFASTVKSARRQRRLTILPEGRR
jgi:hypothetical protein